MPLSQAPNPEAAAADIYEWTEGRALVATEERSPAITLSSGRTVEPSQCSSTYIFPGED
jgi:malate dehydrogenase (oxaloacetate-decarboxylating)(NADP+)